MVGPSVDTFVGNECRRCIVFYQNPPPSPFTKGGRSKELYYKRGRLVGGFGKGSRKDRFEENVKSEI
jgi:hypothetical protein